MKKKLKITLIAGGAGLALAVIIAAVRGVFTADSAKEILLSLTDGSSMAAVVLTAPQSGAVLRRKRTTANVSLIPLS